MLFIKSFIFKNCFNKTIFLILQMDSRSFVSTDYAPGASLATGFISLLGVAKALGEDRHSEDIKALKQNIVFAILDGVSN